MSGRPMIGVLYVLYFETCKFNSRLAALMEGDHSEPVVGLWRFWGA
jgi:hypothetical protein